MYSCVCRRTKLPGTSGRGVQSEMVRDIGPSSGLQARSKDQEILEEGGGAGPSLLPRRGHE